MTAERQVSPLDSLDASLLAKRIVAVGFDDLASPFKTNTPESAQLLTIGTIPVEPSGGIHGGHASNIPTGAAVLLEPPLSTDVQYDEILVAKIKSGASSQWGYDFAGWTAAGNTFGLECLTNDVECKLSGFDTIKVGAGGWRIRSENAFELTFENPFTEEKSLSEIFSAAAGSDAVVIGHTINSTAALFGTSRRFGELTRHDIYFNTDTLLAAARGDSRTSDIVIATPTTQYGPRRSVVCD